MSKFDSPWNDWFNDLTGYSFKIINDAFEILYDFYTEVYKRMKNKENQKEENKVFIENQQMIIKSDQNTARECENKILIPSLNLSNMNNSNFNFRRSETAQNSSKNVNIISGATTDLFLPEIDSNSKRFEIPTQNLESNSHPIKFKPFKIENKNKIKQIKLNRIKFTSKKLCEFKKRNLNLKISTNHNKSGCPSFRNMKESYNMELHNSWKGITRSQSVKEHMILKSSHLYNTDLSNIENLKDNQKRSYFNLKKTKCIPNPI